MKAQLAARTQRLATSRGLKLRAAIKTRFGEINGGDLGAALAVSLFTTVVPLILIGFSYASGFSTSLSFGDVLSRQLSLDNTNTALVRAAFGSGASLRSSWTVLGLAGLLVWGIPLAALVARIFAGAWRRERFPFWHEVLRGLGWFACFLASMAATAAIAPRSVNTPIDGVRLALSFVPSFVLWTATPAILVRDGDIGWRYYARTGLAGVVIEGFVLRLCARLALPALLSGWVSFGPMGVAMTISTWCSIVAACWITTACVGAVLWERIAPTELVINAQTEPITPDPPPGH
jgi:hypothetical protein